MKESKKLSTQTSEFEKDYNEITKGMSNPVEWFNPNGYFKQYSIYDENIVAVQSLKGIS